MSLMFQVLLCWVKIFLPGLQFFKISTNNTIKQDTKIYFVEDWGFSLLFFLVSYWWHLVWHETKYVYWPLASKKELLVQVSRLRPLSAKGVGHLRNNNEIEDMWDYSYFMNAQHVSKLYEASGQHVSCVPLRLKILTYR